MGEQGFRAPRACTYRAQVPADHSLPAMLLWVMNCWQTGGCCRHLCCGGTQAVGRMRRCCCTQRLPPHSLQPKHFAQGYNPLGMLATGQHQAEAGSGVQQLAQAPGRKAGRAQATSKQAGLIWNAVTSSCWMLSAALSWYVYATCGAERRHLGLGLAMPPSCTRQFCSGEQVGTHLPPLVQEVKHYGLAEITRAADNCTESGKRTASVFLNPVACAQPAGGARWPWPAVNDASRTKHCAAPPSCARL